MSEELKCNGCGKEYKYKVYYDKHIVNCGNGGNVALTTNKLGLQVTS